MLERWFISSDRIFLFLLLGKCLIYTDGKGGPEKGAFPIAKETQVMPSNNAPKKDMINRAFFIRTDQKIMYLVADTPQLRDIKMKELSM